MATRIVPGQLTEDGRIEVDLPDGWQPGEVVVEVSVEAEEPLSEGEIDELLKPKPQSGVEIAQADEIGSWRDSWGDFEDGAAYVEHMRRKRREKNQW